MIRWLMAASLLQQHYYYYCILDDYDKEQASKRTIMTFKRKRGMSASVQNVFVLSGGYSVRWRWTMRISGR